MKIFDTKALSQSARATLNQFKSLIKVEYQRGVQSGEKGLLQLREKYSDRDVMGAINIMRLDKEKIIVSDETNPYNIVLKYMEFGGGGIEPSHILSNTKRKLRNGG